MTKPVDVEAMRRMLAQIMAQRTDEALVRPYRAIRTFRRAALRSVSHIALMRPVPEGAR